MKGLNKNSLRITFLGTGTSQGIPVVGCDCVVCSSEDVKDQRLRTSVLIESDQANVVIDSGPDFRQQMLRAKVRKLDAIVFTHAHKDHIAGLDDVRPFNYLLDKEMQVYGEAVVHEALKREFHYAFSDIKYPGVPRLALHLIGNDSFEINGLNFKPIRVMHHKLPVLGFRINDFTYITDANYIAPEELLKVKGSKVMVLNALRKHKHISHFTLNEAYEVFKNAGVGRGYLTHISHLMGTHMEVNKEMPGQLELAYDGLQVNL